ncbi:SDR family oxidoreductase [Microbacterium protaetiae]|uniref:SDR family oxidoreductase n=1 Tax=Microbacterium protaetiae TaxID=2509458 RepID=A0A4P6EFA8_9MICO|nr:SDR family oxidoreductase [Microbacterium protaetiae]QAY58777.1 SDR family oxidoreductase [Microbacterium protaetiae]
MRIAIAGGTGTVGRLVTDLVRRHGHEPVVISRSTGIDLLSGDGLDAVLAGVDAVIDVTSTASMSAAASIRFFETATRNLLAAEQRAGVRHHVVLSIIGIDSVEKGYGYYQGKRAQEHMVQTGPIPSSLLRATQFHEFARQMFERMKVGPFVLVPTMRSQPIEAAEVAARLVELAEGVPAGRVTDIAGPRVERMADLARRYGRAAGLPGRVVELSLPGGSGRQMRDGSLLAGTSAQLRGQDFTTWLRQQTGSDGEAKAQRPMGVAGIPLVRAPLPQPPEPSLTNARELIAGLQTAGMPITLTIDGDERRLPVNIDEAAFRALQEGVGLVLTRTRGVDAAATVRYLAQAVEIEVSHGPGRVTPHAQLSATLSRSRTEIRRLGGAVASGPTADGGFRVSATIPTPG